LVKLKSYFRKAGLQSEQMVMSVPSYFTALERQAFLDAVNIANLGCLNLINEGSATALSYGFYR
jgi:heat shock protein 4